MQIVINSPGTFLTQKNECFRLKKKEKYFDVSTQKVESIGIPNQSMISTQAIILALEHNIDIIFLDSFGDPLDQPSICLILCQGKKRIDGKGKTTNLRQKDEME